MKEISGSPIVEQRVNMIRNQVFNQTNQNISEIPGVSDIIIFQRNCDPNKVVPNKTLLAVKSIFMLENKRPITSEEYKANIKASGDAVIKRDTPLMEERIKRIKRKQELVGNRKYLKRFSG